MIFRKKISSTFVMLIAVLRVANAAADPTWDGHTLRVTDGVVSAAITPISDDVIRVRVAKGDRFGRGPFVCGRDDQSWSDSGQSDHRPNETILKTATLTVHVQHHPIRVRFANSAGETLDADNNEAAIRFPVPLFVSPRTFPRTNTSTALVRKAAGWTNGAGNWVDITM